MPLAAPFALGAQSTASAYLSATPAVRACLDSLQPTVFTRVIVYVDAIPTGRYAPPELVARADSFASTVAASIRLRTAHDTGSIGPGEPALTWRTLGTVALAFHRDGRITDVIPPLLHRLMAHASLLNEVVDSLAPLGSGPPIRGDAPVADSATFIVHFVAPGFDSNGKPQSITAHAPFPAAKVLVPWSDSVKVVHYGSVAYPAGMARAGAIGTITLQAVIDETGHADMSTAHAIWDSPDPEPKGGAALTVYQAFVREAMDGLRASVFEPARVGGCAVRAAVRIPFVFHFEH